MRLLRRNRQCFFGKPVSLLRTAAPKSEHPRVRKSGDHVQFAAGSDAPPRGDDDRRHDDLHEQCDHGDRAQFLVARQPSRVPRRPTWYPRRLARHDHRPRPRRPAYPLRPESAHFAPPTRSPRAPRPNRPSLTRTAAPAPEDASRNLPRERRRREVRPRPPPTPRSVALLSLLSRPRHSPPTAAASPQHPQDPQAAGATSPSPPE